MIASAPSRYVNLSPPFYRKTGYRCDSSMYLAYRIHNIHMAVWAVSDVSAGRQRVREPGGSRDEVSAAFLLDDLPTQVFGGLQKRKA